LTEISILKRDLADLPIDQLGEWSWILVRSLDWKTISKKLEIDSSKSRIYLPRAKGNLHRGGPASRCSRADGNTGRNFPNEQGTSSTICRGTRICARLMQ